MSDVVHIRPEQFSSEMEATRRCFDTGRSKDVEWRRRQLKVQSC